MTLLQARCSINSLRYGGKDEFWITLIGENNVDYSITAPCICVASDGGIFFVTENPDGTNPNVLVVGKLNKDGTLNWAKEITYQQSSTFFSLRLPGGGGLQKIIRDSSDNVYVVATANDMTDVGVVYSFSSTGTELFEDAKSITSNSVNGISIAFASSDFANLYVCFTEATTDDTAIVKMGATTGTISWQTEIVSGDIFNNSRGSTAVDGSYNVFLFTTNETTDDWVLAKFNSSGTMQWAKSFIYESSATIVFSNSLISDSSGNLIVQGADRTNDAHYIAKVDASSNSSATNFVHTWTRKTTWSGASDLSAFNAACVDSAGNVYAAYFFVATTGPNGVFVVKYNSSGTIQWQRRLEVSVNSVAQEVSQPHIVVDSKDNLMLSCTYEANIHYASATTQRGNLFAKLPADGSGTGTHTIGAATVTYSASSLTDASATPTKVANDPSSGTPVYTDYATTMTLNATTLLESKVKI